MLLRWLEDEGRVAAEAGHVIRSPANAVAVSAATMLEVSLKRTLGKLSAPGDFSDHVRAAKFEPLPVTWEHAWAAGELPLHHRDPFDRLLVAQAQVEGLTLVTRDPQLARYGVPVLAA